MSALARAYTFATPAQWKRCLAQRFDARNDGSLEPIPRLGSRPRRDTTQGPVSLVAVDPYGAPYWRVDAQGRIALLRRNELGAVAPPFELDPVLARSPRWVLDRDWLWAFDAKTSTMARYERQTLEPDLVVTLGELCCDDRRLESNAYSLIDIASDGRGGLWVLLAEGTAQWWLAHIDCEGRCRGLLPVPPLPIPCATGVPVELASIARGETLALLEKGGKHLFLIDAATAAIRRVVTSWDPDPCWKILHLAADTRNRMALLARHTLCRDRWAVFVLDSHGDALHTFYSPTEPTSAEPTAAPQSQPEELRAQPNDVAVSGNTLWFAANDGLWRLDASEGSTARESESVLVTPVLLSPESDEGRGWLRAELDMDLPRGAALEIDFASTNDDRVANEAIRIGSDDSSSAVQRQTLLWDALDITRSTVFHLTAPFAAGQPISVPLFETDNRWLWLRIKIVTPPGVAPQPIKRLRVLYPDASLMRDLPTVFRGTQYDPTGALRSIVGVLEATTQSIDQRIGSIASQIDPDTAPAEWLDYLARWLDLPWDDALPLDVKRRIVQHAGILLALRGTRRGLQQLLTALVGPTGSAEATDLTVDHAPARLGGGKCRAPALPLLLAGASPKAPILNGKAVLGQACLGVPCDPLRCIVPTVYIELTASRAAHRELGPVLRDILAQYLPAGIAVRVSWRVRSPLLAPADGDGEVLDGFGPGALGSDSELGRTVLIGRGAAPLDDAGCDSEFRLQ